MLSSRLVTSCNKLATFEATVLPANSDGGGKRRAKHRGGQSALEEPLPPYRGCELFHPGGSPALRRLGRRGGRVRLATCGAAMSARRHAASAGHVRRRKRACRSAVVGGERQHQRQQAISQGRGERVGPRVLPAIGRSSTTLPRLPVREPDRFASNRSDPVGIDHAVVRRGSRQLVHAEIPAGVRPRARRAASRRRVPARGTARANTCRSSRCGCSRRPRTGMTGRSTRTVWATRLTRCISMRLTRRS